MAKPKKPFTFHWFFLLPIPALWCALGYFGLLDFLEHQFLDLRFRYRGELNSPVKVVYVDLDSKAVANLGNEPWDRSYYVDVCSTLLSVGKAKAIGIDLVFSEKGKPEIVDEKRFEEGNKRLAAFLGPPTPTVSPPIVVAAGYASSNDRDINDQPIVRQLPKVIAPQKDIQPPERPEFRTSPRLIVNPPLIGLIDTLEGGTRWVPVFVPTEPPYYHLAVRLAQLYWDLPDDLIKVFDDRVDFMRRDGIRQTSIPLSDRQNVEVNWFSRWISPHANPRSSFVDVLGWSQIWQAPEKPGDKKAAQEFFSQFQNAIVLIGPVDPLFQDLAATPFDSVPVPRVGIHGNLLKTIVSGIYLREMPWWANLVFIFGVTGAVCGLAIAGDARRRGGWRVAAVAVLCGYIFAAFFLFAHFHLVLPLAAPIGAAFTTSFAGVVWKLVTEEKQKSRIKGMFGTYVSPELVNRMVESGEDPKLGGAEVEITAYFSDIQNFSTFSEQLSPTQQVELMNEYLTACTDIVTAAGGTLDKYIGDAVVAMFGAPLALSDHAYRACVATQLVQARLGELRKKWTAEGDKWPATVRNMHTRIGLNSGAAVVGNMGSLTRFNYTMMGDNVNLAARMESGAKNYGAGTLVTEATKLAAEKHGDRCVFRFLDRIVVKGRTQPVAIYEIIGLKETVSPAILSCIEIFNRAIECYRRQDRTEAGDLFRKSATLERLRSEASDELTPSAVYVQRCEIMKINPPGKDWDGVYVMRTK